MKATNVVILTLSLAISSLAFAEGGGDRAVERMEQARQTAMATGKSAPGAEAQENIAQEKLKAEKPPHHC